LRDDGEHSAGIDTLGHRGASVHSAGKGRFDLQFHEKLLAFARPVSFPQGARLVRQGEPSRGAFLIGRGEAEAQVALPGGGTLAVAELRDGDLFGEMALIERGVCCASVVARSAVEGWFIERDDFRAMVASRDPAALEIQRNITRVLAARLRALNAKVRSHPAAEDRPFSENPRTADFSYATASFDWRGFLSILPFFEGFDAYEIDELVARCRALELPRGAWLFVPAQPATACFIVVRGAMEIFSFSKELQRRVALAGPGELVGYLAILEGNPHAAAARVRETACVLELSSKDFLEIYGGDSGTSVSLQHAIHKSLLRSLARTNTQLTRLISHAHLTAGKDAADLEKALHGQIVQSS
jgi:CRP/FNR family cyclic AMP-dependent transcriptional regulator